jgi:hypothetical protein
MGCEGQLRNPFDVVVAATRALMNSGPGLGPEWSKSSGTEPETPHIRGNEGHEMAEGQPTKSIVALISKVWSAARVDRGVAVRVALVSKTSMRSNIDLRWNAKR